MADPEGALDVLPDNPSRAWTERGYLAEEAMKFLLRPMGIRALEDRTTKVEADEGLKRWCTLLRWADDGFVVPCAYCQGRDGKGPSLDEEDSPD